MTKPDMVLGATVILGICLLLAGCDLGAVQAHYRAQTIVAGALTVGGEVVTEARTTALVRVEQANSFMPPEERIVALKIERANWEPVGAALDAARSALSTWETSTETAESAGADEDLLGILVRLASRVILLYDEAARLAATLGADLPPLPEVVTSLARSIGGGR